MHQRSIANIEAALRRAVDQDNCFILAQLCQDELRTPSRLGPLLEARLEYNLALALLRRCDRIGNQGAAAHLERALQLFTGMRNDEGRMRTLLLLAQLKLRSKETAYGNTVQLTAVYRYCSQHGLTEAAVVAAIQLILLHDPQKEPEAYRKANKYLRRYVTQSWLAFKFWSSFLKVHPEELIDLKRHFF